VESLQSSQVWGFTHVIPALGKLRQESLQSEASLGYIQTLCQKERRGGEGRGGEERRKEGKERKERKERKKEKKEARYLWLIPVILATWEAEIGGSQFKANPGQIVCETPSPK
jgi:hypothetical protein